jgi:UDP-N-acetylmuramoylalanine--D-glutamate ligase
MSKPVIWIAGGKDSGIDYSQLKSLFKTKIKSIIFLGMDNEHLISAISDFKIPVSDASSMDEAVELAYLSGAMGDVVLLSPGCPSFDLFKNYEERGNEFKKAVNQL